MQKNTSAYTPDELAILNTPEFLEAQAEWEKEKAEKEARRARAGQDWERLAHALAEKARAQETARQAREQIRKNFQIFHDMR